MRISSYSAANPRQSSRLIKFSSVVIRYVKRSERNGWHLATFQCLKLYYSFFIIFIAKYLLTYSMEQSPSWEANRFSDSQENSRIFGNMMIHYRIHKCPPPFPILSQLDTVHNTTHYLLKIHLNIILPPKPDSPKWSLSFRFHHKKPVYAFPHSPIFTAELWNEMLLWRVHVAGNIIDNYVIT